MDSGFYHFEVMVGGNGKWFNLYSEAMPAASGKGVIHLEESRNNGSMMAIYDNYGGSAGNRKFVADRRWFATTALSWCILTEN